MTAGRPDACTGVCHCLGGFCTSNLSGLLPCALLAQRMTCASSHVHDGGADALFDAFLESLRLRLPADVLHSMYVCLLCCQLVHFRSTTGREGAWTSVCVRLHDWTAAMMVHAPVTLCCRFHGWSPPTVCGFCRAIIAHNSADAPVACRLRAAYLSVPSSFNHPCAVGCGGPARYAAASTLCGHWPCAAVPQMREGCLCCPICFCKACLHGPRHSACTRCIQGCRRGLH